MLADCPPALDMDSSNQNEIPPCQLPKMTEYCLSATQAAESFCKTQRPPASRSPSPEHRLSPQQTDNPGLTLFHCHQQLHMDFGFMALLRYA